MAHNILGFINTLKKDVNNLIHPPRKFFSRAPSLESRSRRAREKFFSRMMEVVRRVRGEKVLLEEGSEDPVVVSFDAVVGDDGIALAATHDADEGPAA